MQMLACKFALNLLKAGALLMRTEELLVQSERQENVLNSLLNKKAGLKESGDQLQRRLQELEETLKNTHLSNQSRRRSYRCCNSSYDYSCRRNEGGVPHAMKVDAIL